MRVTRARAYGYCVRIGGGKTSGVTKTAICEYSDDRFI